MKNKKFPKTHTVFGVKCTQIYFGPGRFVWMGANDQFSIDIFDRRETLSYRYPNDKRYSIEVMLKTFHNIRFKATGDTLKEAQEEILSRMQEDTNEYKQLLWDTQGAFYYAQH